MAQALRTVYERLFRAGLRDWELEWDYVECAYWPLRRGLEVNAREGFRVWYGEEKWREPFRFACHLQETGHVEYRIEHLLTSELGVEIRGWEKPRGVVHGPKPTPGHARRRARYGELRNDLLKLVPEFMTPGKSLDVAEIARYLRVRVAYQAHDLSVKYALATHPGRFAKDTEPINARSTKTRYALKPR